MIMKAKIGNLRKDENPSKRREGRPTRRTADQYSERRGENSYSEGSPIFKKNINGED